MSQLPKIFQYLQLAWLAHVRWWKWTIPTSLLMAITAGLGVWYLNVPLYTSVETLRIKEESPYIAFPNQERSSTFVSTQLQLFRQRVVQTPAINEVSKKYIDRIKELEDPYEWINKGLAVRVIANSELVEVRFRDKDPQLARDMVAAIVSSYMDYHHDYDDNLNVFVIENLTRECNNHKATLSKLREEVLKISKEVAAGDAKELESDEMTGPLSAIHRLLIDTQVDKELAKAEYEALRGNVDANDVKISENDLQQLIASDPQVLEMQRHLADLELKKGEWEKSLVTPERSTKYQDLKREITRVQQTIQTTQERVRASAQAELRLRGKSDRESRVQQLAMDIDSKEAMIKFLEKRLSEEGTKKSETSGSVVNLQFKRAELQQEEEIYDRLSSRIVSLQTEQKAPARVTTVGEDGPTVPVRADNDPLLFVLAASGGSLLVPLVFVTVLELLMQRVTGMNEIRGQDLEILGEIASLPKYVPALNDSSSRSLTLFEESVNHLCTSLRLSSDLREKQVIAIASAISGEGKTHVAVQLAISLARSSREPVILLECDFRAPNMGSLLNLENDFGLLDVFSGDKSFDSVLHREVEPNLDVVTAGVRRRNLHELLQGNQIDELINVLRQRYTYIVIDTPPVLAAGEAMLFTSAADATLVCARSGHSRVTQVREVHERLVRSQSNPVGVVLNGVSRSRYVSNYGTY